MSWRDSDGSLPGEALIRVQLNDAGLRHVRISISDDDPIGRQIILRGHKGGQVLAVSKILNGRGDPLGDAVREIVRAANAIPGPTGKGGGRG
jgi:hypothetical protein